MSLIYPYQSQSQKGLPWATWRQGNGIADIVKINTVWLVDTYRILFTNGTYTDYDVTNWNPHAGIWDMIGSNNLSEITDESLARGNLWLWTLATQNGTFTDKEDVANKSTSVTTDLASNTKYPSVKSVYDWATTTLSKYLGDADFYQYSISRTVSGGNLTVSLLNFEWNTPTATKPVKKMINGVVYTITSALSTTIASWVNWYNAWSAELATKEIDYFTYIGRKSSTWAFFLIPSRISTAVKNTDLSFSIANEKFGYGADNLDTWDEVVNIGRFNAILSGGAWYTWSIPATSVIVNNTVIGTYRKQANTVVTAGSWSLTTASWAIEYTLIWWMLSFNWYVTITTNWTGAGYVNLTLPFTPTWASISYLAGGRSEWWPSAGKQLQLKSGWTNILSMFTYDNLYPGWDGSSLHLSWSYPI